MLTLSRRSAIHAPAVALALAFMLGGCATPLDSRTGAPDVANAIGVSSSNVTFVSYCSFGMAAPSEGHVSFDEGIVAMTPDSVVLLTGDLPHTSVFRRIAYRNIRGADLRRFGRGRQLQLLTSDGVMVIEISKNKAVIDAQGSESARQILRQRGVPDWASDHFYLRRPKTSVVPVPI